ncbi:MAG: gliding motility-associated ABC transporter substrate-binding protein GldG [Flavobacteriales bacterium]|nr:gliding motility-associated ABC transporter substrate-binding protein GldG [Flavobacteriales bacterium]|tara:strand:+ start:2305 stop:4017 length:1713 start_codon:yes stop_codon:yes gene_type:complete
MIKNKLKDLTNFLTGFIIILILMIFSYFSFIKIDLTEDKRFTLHESTIELMETLDDVVEFKIYLENEHLPADLTRVRNSILETLEELSDISDGYVEYEFIDLYNTIEDPKTREQSILNLKRRQGLEIVPIPFRKENGELDRVYVPLGAEAFYKGRSIPVPFIRQAKGNKTNTYEKAIEELEFEITNAIRKLKQDSMKTIAFLQGHGELGRFDVEDFSKSLYEYYQTGPAYIKNKEGKEQLNALNGIDLLIIAKPVQPFTQKEQYIIDQFIMNGGKVLMMLEGAQGAELDSMQTQGIVFAAPLETGLDAMLHKYGVRLNKHIVEDLQCSKIPIQTTASGSGGRFQLYSWIYNPVLKSKNNHIINKNLDPVKVEFCSSFDTTSIEDIKFTTLYQTSGNNRYKKLPSRISFRETANEKIISDNFKKGSKPVALLLEGEFGSYFKNRIAPEFTANKKIKFKDVSGKNKMIVIADGDIGKNWFSQRQEMIPLGTDQYSNVFYDNKKFLVNCANYLLGDEELISVRSKKIKMRLLDSKMVKEKKGFITILNTALPIGIILLISFVFIIFRKVRFSK